MIWNVLYSRLKLSLVERSTGGSEKIQFHKDMECISVYCNYLFLKKKTALRGEFKIQFHRDMDYVLGCVNFLLKA